MKLVICMEIEDIRKVYADHGMKIVGHAERRMRERHIELYEIRDAILHGEIIEARYDEEPRPRYLILKAAKGCAPLHVILGVDWRTVDVITAYRPNPQKWDSTFRYRRD